MLRAVAMVLAVLTAIPVGASGDRHYYGAWYGHHGSGGRSGDWRYVPNPKRDPAVARQFQRENPCPSTHKTYGACPGYVKDHIKPLACGGRDHPSNMQWQTVADAKVKDAWELKACRGH